VASGIAFDWDDENRKHLATHKVAPAEFEQVLNNDPIDLAFDLVRRRTVPLRRPYQSRSTAVGGVDDPRRQGACHYRLSG